MSETETVLIGLRVPTSQARLIGRLAEWNHRTVSAEVRAALAEHLDRAHETLNEESPRELAASADSRNHRPPVEGDRHGP
jgi:hypothetical protein